MRLHVINGPNLNLLGSREPEVYGKETLADIEKRVSAIADKKFEVKFFQHNTEGELVSYVQNLKKGSDIAIINAAAYTHTSIALRDALSAVDIEFIEVHISNVYKRESFRHHSYLSDISGGVIVGLGTAGYDLAAAHFVKKYA